MVRLLSITLFFVGCLSLCCAEEPAQTQSDSKASPLKQAVIDNPEDAAALRTFLVDRLNALNGQADESPDEVEKQLKDLETFLATLKPEEKATQQLLAQGKAALKSVERRIVLARLSIEDIPRLSKRTRTM